MCNPMLLRETCGANVVFPFNNHCTPRRKTKSFTTIDVIYYTQQLACSLKWNTSKEGWEH